MGASQDSPVTFLPLGAIIQSFKLGGRDIVLGFPTADLYRTRSHPYFGEVIGRYANRLSNGKVEGLNGRDYDFVKNERGKTTLHGGVEGWGKKVWEGPTTVTRNSKEVTQFVLKSPDDDEGFPGAVEARVFYGVQKRLDGEGGAKGKEEVILDVEYEVEMVGDEPDITETIVSVTNHRYVDARGNETLLAEELTMSIP